MLNIQSLTINSMKSCWVATKSYFLVCLVPADFFGVGELLADAEVPEVLVLLRFRPAPGCSEAWVHLDETSHVCI